MLFKIIGAVVGLLVILAGVGGIMYATDAPVKADVIDQDCNVSGASTITIKTKFPIPGITHELEVSNSVCGIIASLRADGEDPYVEYKVKSGQTTLWDDHPDKGGKVIYQS